MGPRWLAEWAEPSRPDSAINDRGAGLFLVHPVGVNSHLERSAAGAEDVGEVEVELAAQLPHEAAELVLGDAEGLEQPLLDALLEALARPPELPRCGHPVHAVHHRDLIDRGLLHVSLFQERALARL